MRIAWQTTTELICLNYIDTDNVRHAEMVEWVLFSLISSIDTTLCNSRERTVVGDSVFQLVPKNGITSYGLEVRAFTRRKFNQALCLTSAPLFRAQIVYCILCTLII